MEAIQGTSFRRIAIVVALGVLAALVITNLSGSGQDVTATHTPADKVFASGEELVDVEAGTAVPIMTATVRASKPTDLIMSVTLECAILTKLHNAFAPADGSSMATATAQIDVWIEDQNGKVVPISDVSSPPQNPGSGGTILKDSVTFCQREESRRITDTETSDDGTDEVVSYQDAKTANAFNWVLLNVGSGIHTFTVKATLTESSPCTKDLSSETCSDALIGNRTFVIGPAKLANDATI